MNRKIKNWVAISSAATIVLSSAGYAFASPQYYSGTTATTNTGTATAASESAQTAPKNVLTIKRAIDSAISSNINLKKFEVQRQTLLKEIDGNTSSYMSIFAQQNYLQQNLPNPTTDPDAYAKAKAEMEAAFNKRMAANDVTMAQLVNQRGVIDLSKVMEREGVILSVNRLFTSIAQKQRDIEILTQKIAQDQKNYTLNEKQYELGKISHSKLQEYSLDLTKNKNQLMIEQGKLQNYFNELENLTQISNIQRDYTLEKQSVEYKPVELTAASQKAQQERAADYSVQVISKVANTKIQESLYENYPYVTAPDSTTNFAKLSDEKYIAQLEESQAKRDAKSYAQTKYNNLQELQLNIEIAQNEITKLEKQLSDIQSKYKLGLISKNALDNSSFALDEARNNLESLKLQHYQLRMLYENAYFAGLA